MFRDIIFEVITASDIYKRFDSSDNTSGTFSVLEKRTDKKLQDTMEQKILITFAENPKREPCIIKGYAINLKNTEELRQDQLEWDLKISLKELVKGFGEL